MNATSELTSERLSQVVQETAGRLRGFIRQRVPSDVDPDDVVQDVFARLANHRQHVDGARVYGWLFSAARNAITDIHRRRRPPAELEDDAVADLRNGETTPEAIAELSSCLRPMLSMLNDEDRRLLEHVDLHNRSQADIARDDAVPLSTIKSRTQRARGKLRRLIDDCCRIELDGRGLPVSHDCRGKNPCAKP